MRTGRVSAGTYSFHNDAQSQRVGGKRASVNNNEQFFRVARLHSALMTVHSELNKLERLRATQLAAHALTAHLPIEDRDVRAIDDELASLLEREAELLERRRELIERLWPDFLDLADNELERLDSSFGADGWNDLPERCFDTLETVTMSFVHRLENAISSWNHVGEALTEFSQGLPLNDSEMNGSDMNGSEEPTLPFDSPVTRLGPNERGKYAGIEVKGRSVALVSRHETLEWFLAELERRLVTMMKEAREQLLSGKDSTTEIELDPAPKKLFWREVMPDQI